MNCPTIFTGSPLYQSGFKGQKQFFVKGIGMRFDLLNLHCPKEDSNVRKLLRVYSVIPRFTAHDNPTQAKQAIRVTAFLRAVNKRLRKEVGLSWKKEWLEPTEYSVSQPSYKDWFIGRASVPLIALKRLETFGLKDEVEALVDSCDFFCSTTGVVSRMPHEMNPNLAYILGAILGDGHIRKDGETISFEVTERKLTEKVIQKLHRIFEHKLNLHSRSKRGRLYYSLSSNNKPAVRLFTKFLEVPRGKKSHKIFVPKIIKNSGKETRLAFLEGVFDTEGCIRRKGLRVTSASKLFRDDLCELLVSFGEKGFKDEWINKKYNKKYYGLQYSIRNIPFLAGMPESGQSGQV